MDIHGSFIVCVYTHNKDHVVPWLGSPRIPGFHTRFFDWGGETFLALLQRSIGGLGASPLFNFRFSEVDFSAILMCTCIYNYNSNAVK